MSRFTWSVSADRQPAKLLRTTRLSRLLWLAFAWFLLGIFPAYGAEQSSAGSSPANQPGFTTGSRVYLPVITNADDFALNPPIWASANPAQPTEVALFRLSFNLPETLAPVELQLFADTRYQAWLDGNWIGRGPARFARTVRQYDVYRLTNLAPGEHTLAVLVQWSPDERRSESVRPLLQGCLQGTRPDGSPLVIRSGPTWSALLSPAWRSDAARIHQWGLIGFSELLDLSQLPADWNQPGFTPAGWSPAVVVDPTQEAASLDAWQASFESLAASPQQPAAPALLEAIRYTPRDIPFPVDTAVPVTLLDSGALLAGQAIAELPAGTPLGYTLPFQADNNTPVTIETLGIGVEPDGALILLDGSTLAWQVAGAERPDVYLAQAELTAGAHTLTFNPPDEGLTFALSTYNLSGLTLPFEQGNHAGRRLLLAEPVSQPGSVVANPGELNSLEFIQLPAYVVLDLGQVIHGRLSAQVSGPAGTVIDIGWDERLLEGTLRPLPYPGSLHSLWNQTDSWVLDGTTRQLSTIDARSGRYILIAMWGSGSARLDELGVYSEQYPLIQIGEFQSSDALLDQIWQIGVDTARLNMVDASMDPWRERGQWWGDSYLVDQINQVAFGDAGLLRRGLLLMENAFAESGAPGCAPHNNNLHMLDYAMLWVHSLADYARRTGDLDLLAETYPTLQQFIQHLSEHTNPGTGLLDLPKTSWAETAYIDSLGTSSRYGQSAALNALYYATLQQAAGIALQLGDTPNHELWQARAEAVKSNLNSLLYLPEQGRYLTNIYDGIAYPPTLFAQAWPLAYGLAPEGEQQRVASALLELLSQDPGAPNVGTYGFYWILKGLGQAGSLDQALSVTKSYYGRMIDRGATTWWESFLADQSYSNALSHGWGGGPTWFLTTYILGMTQTAPEQWRFEPALDSLPAASGAIPLYQGTLQAGWQTHDCPAGASTGTIHLQVSAPAGTHGQVVLPHSIQWINLNGSPLPTASLETTPGSSLVVLPLAAGVHRIEIGMACAEIP